jgi:hypothetical protein
VVRASTADILNAFGESYRTHTVNTQCGQNAGSLSVTESGTYIRLSLNFKRLVAILWEVFFEGCIA